MLIRLDWQKTVAFPELDETFKVFEKNNITSGIYIWIWQGTPKRVCYVGETSDFRARFSQHMIQLIGGGYNIYDTNNSDDLLTLFMDHWNGKKINEVISAGKVYIPMLHIPGSSFQELADADLIKKRLLHLKHLRFAFAAVTSTATLTNFSLKYVEAALIDALIYAYQQEKGCNFALVDWKRPLLPFGAISKRSPINFVIEHCGNTEAIPEVILCTKATIRTK
jgi:hypothetical protein